jgi:hypothetical protein
LTNRASGRLIHPNGNPHVWLDPLLAKVEAGNICEALKRADPAGAPYYDARRQDLAKRLDEALFGPELVKLIGIQKLTRLAETGQLDAFLSGNQLGGQPLAARAGGWLKAAAPLRGAKAYEYHRVWAYFARLFGIQLASGDLQGYETLIAILRNDEAGFARNQAAELLESRAGQSFGYDASHAAAENRAALERIEEWARRTKK